MYLSDPGAGHPNESNQFMVIELKAVTTHVMSMLSIIDWWLSGKGRLIREYWWIIEGLLWHYCVLISAYDITPHGRNAENMDGNSDT